MPTYNFCVVVDDIDMQISHVIRGDGHVMNTPRQINIFRAFGKGAAGSATPPTVLGNDGEKLSNATVRPGLNEYAANGYLPRRSSTASRASAGRTATTKSSRRSSWLNGST